MSTQKQEKEIKSLENKLLKEKAEVERLKNKLQNINVDEKNVDVEELKKEVQKLQTDIEKYKKQIYILEKYFVMPDFIATIVNAVINGVDGVDDINGAFKYIFAPYWAKDRLKPTKEEIEEFLQIVKNDAIN